MALYLTIKEIWRNRNRYLTFSLVIALITVLVLFIAGLGEGLATANKEFIEKIDGELLLFQENTELSTTASRIAWSKLNDIQRVPGVAEVGPIGLATATIVYPELENPLDVSLIGVEPGKPGQAPAYLGRDLLTERGLETVIDEDIAAEMSLELGDTIIIKTIQGTEDEFFELTIVGIATGQQYFFLPSIFVPYQTWDRIRPQANPGVESELTANIIAIKLQNPEAWEEMIPVLQTQVDGIEAVDKVTAYEAGPGYAAQQSTLNTQKGFTLLISVLVIGGFFQIQTLQKVPQIGMLKAIGASNTIVATAALLQIVIVTAIGILLGSSITLLLSLGFPANIPIIFTGNAILTAIISLFLIGPIGGMVAIRLALRVEPLTALGLNS
ncbi:MAG: ABC transporter permease [Anaerolineales bacterium]|nr:ABC transporter permease [Anaerolineales bacterium]